MKIMRNGKLETVVPDAELPPAALEARRLRQFFGASRLSPEEQERINNYRRPDGTYLPGTSGFPGGSVRKAREDRYFTDALKATFELMGGVQGLFAWAKKHPTHFYHLIGKLIPVQMTIEREQGDRTLTIRHALPPPRYSNQPKGSPPPDPGTIIELIDPTDVTPAQLLTAIKTLDREAKDELIAAIRDSLNTEVEDAQRELRR